MQEKQICKFMQDIEVFNVSKETLNITAFCKPVHRQHASVVELHSGWHKLPVQINMITYIKYIDQFSINLKTTGIFSRT